MDVNPLRIHLHRANILRRYRNIPLLFEPEADRPTSIQAVAEEPASHTRPQRQNKSPIRAEVSIRRHYDVNVRVTVENPADTEVREAAGRSLTDLNLPLPNLAENLGPGRRTASPRQAVPVSRGRLEEAVRNIDIQGQKVCYTSADVVWPSGIVSYSGDIPQLFKDWHSSSLVQLKGVPVPLKYWGQLFGRVNSPSWQTFKKEYSEQKVSLFKKSVY